MSKKHIRNAKRSEAQIAASRFNGALSKGPVTPEGKAIVARNAITHGAHAANPVLQGESQQDFDALLDAFTLDSFPDRECPPNVTESCLLRDIASARWRRQRTINMERALIDVEMEKVEPAVHHLVGTPDLALHMVAASDSLMSNDNFTLEKLQRQETRLERLESRATAQLQALKAARLKERELALHERRLALEEAALAASTSAQNAKNLETKSKPNNVTVLVPMGVRQQQQPWHPEEPATSTPDPENSNSQSEPNTQSQS